MARLGSRLGSFGLGLFKLGNVEEAGPPQTLDVPFIASATTVYTTDLVGTVDVPFIASVTVVRAPDVVSPYIDVPFIASATNVYTPDLVGTVDVPFIASVTAVFAPYVQPDYIDVPFIASATVVYALEIEGDLDVPFIPSSTVVYAPYVQPDYIEIPFIASSTVVYAPYVQPDYIDVPFIPSVTSVLPITAIWTPGTGPGNGGELFFLQLSPAGAPVTVQLDGAISSGASSFVMTTPIAGLVADTGFCVTIDDEVIYVGALSLDGLTASALSRGMSNTLAASHVDASDVTWGDTYDMAAESQSAIRELLDDGKHGFLVSLDCTQAYLDGDRYATHVSEFLGMFPPGSTTNKVDQAQPSSVSAVDGVTDEVPVGLTVPAMIVDDIDAGDIALCRYVNDEASPLVLGPRSALIQSWYGLARVDGDNDPAFADPDANITDGSTSETFPDSSALVTANLDADLRFFTNPDVSGFSDKAILMSGLSIRHGTGRVPLWTSPNWHNFDYVYCGFATDANFVQIIAKRQDLEGIIPGSADIAGPNATWDEDPYYTSTAWHVVLTSYDGESIIIGPSANGTPPNVNPIFNPTDVITVPPGPTGGGPPVTGGEGDEGGSGGNIPPPGQVSAVGLYLDAAMSVFPFDGEISLL